MQAEIDAIVTEAISLSGYIKVALVILSILLILAIIRLSSFGLRCIAFKAKSWMRADENKPPPQVILLMPTENGGYRKSSTVYADPQTKNVLDRIQRESFELFHNDYEEAVPIRKKPPKLGSLRENI
ncbi:hypothetical protein TELCIR_18557 [Teladorsagia circumcincta]|uniref:Uncharacterized protein n=1 Tax=Teladorsagia circumcincta TaxID=45464 RepID=A0A2G9TPM2_TELCI|nr:hypothetical protein TELCIR_18557 [Teladorsagia circumcincta]